MKNQDSGGAKIIMFGIVFIISIAVVFGGLWLLWLLGSWVLPQIYPSGPANFINPPYLLFVGMWFLVMVISRWIFNGIKGND